MSSVYRPNRAADIRSGGKLVRFRRAATRRTPYDRPPVASSPNPTSENPNWLSRLIYSPTRTIASGAGKLLSSVFSTDSSSSSSSSGSDDDDDDVSSQETDRMGKNGTAEIIMPNGSEDMTEMSEGKRKIEQLLMQETFSREECDRLIRIIKSRVEDSAMAADTVDKGLIELPSRTIDSDAMPELCSAAVNEAKKWLEKKKLGSNSKSEVDLGPCTLNTDVLPDFVEGEVGSPVEVAKLYMQNRPPWASPSTSHIGYKSTSPTGIQLFKEGTPYSLGFSSSSPSKMKRDSPASGSWSVSEELRKVRSKATEEMLKSLPSSKIDWSSFALEHKSISNSLFADDIEARIRDRMQKSTQALDGSVVLALGATKTHVTQVTQELQKEALAQNPTVLVTEQNQNVDSNQTVEENKEEQGHQPFEDMKTESHSAAVKMVDGNWDKKGPTQPLNSITRGSMQDSGLDNENGTTSKEVDMTDEIVEANGFPSSGTSLSAGHGPPDTEHYTGPVSSDNDKTNSIPPADKDVKILTEASMEVPNELENDVLPSGSHNGSSSMGNKNVSEDIQVTSKQDVTSKVNGTSHKKGQKLSKYNRRGTSRGRTRARVNKD